MAGEAVMTLYGRGRRVQKCLAVHAFAADGGGELRVAPFTKGVTNRTPWFLARSPLGKVRRASPLFPSAGSGGRAGGFRGRGRTLRTALDPPPALPAPPPPLFSPSSRHTAAGVTPRRGPVRGAPPRGAHGARARPASARRSAGRHPAARAAAKKKSRIF